MFYCSASVSDTSRQCRTPVEEDAADVIVADRGFLGAGGHSQRPEETVDQDVELVDVPAIEKG